MPPIEMYVPPGHPARKRTILLDTDERRRMTENYKKARNYYDGNQAKPLGIDEEDGTDDNVVVNLVRMCADRTISFLFPKMPQLVTDQERAQRNADELWLEEAWEHNGGLSFLHQIALTGYLSGHVFVHVRPPDEDHPYPRLINLDPSRVLPYWKADDINTVLFYEIRWSVGDMHYVLDVVYNPPTRKESPIDDHNPEVHDPSNLYDGTDSWVIHKMVDGKMQAFEVRDEPATWSLLQYESKSDNFPDKPVKRDVWRHRYSPIVHWQHLPNPNQFYGKSEMDNIGLQDTVNLMFGNMNRILRYHGSPKTVGTGFSADEVEKTAIGGLWTIENENARIQNLEMQSELSAMQAIVQFLIDGYFAEKRVVRLQNDIKDFQRVTNAGVRTVFMDALSKNGVLRQQYHPAIVNLSHRMALAAGKGELAPQVLGGDPLPTDELEVLQTMQAEYDLGLVSQQELAIRRGYNWETVVKQRKAEEAAGLAPEKPQPNQNKNNFQNQDQQQ